MRHQLLTFLFEISAGPYAALKSRTPWNLSRAQLRAFPTGTLGQVLGDYLATQDFELMPKLEAHDICHLMTGTPTDVPGEVSLQFLLLGNGKRSAYLFGVLFLGGLLFPELWSRFRAEVAKGAALPRFFDIDYRPRLYLPLEEALPTGVGEHLLDEPPRPACVSQAA